MLPGVDNMGKHTYNSYDYDRSTWGDRTRRACAMCMPSTGSGLIARGRCSQDFRSSKLISLLDTTNCSIESRLLADQLESAEAKRRMDR